MRDLIVSVLRTLGFLKCKHQLMTVSANYEYCVVCGKVIRNLKQVE
jgi:hypothetical protein